jgi:hypothetical protein
MTVIGTVSSVVGDAYRVNVGGSVSAPIPRTSGACRLKKDGSGAVIITPPVVGDAVLCWFPGNAFRDGVISGILEGSG